MMPESVPASAPVGQPSPGRGFFSSLDSPGITGPRRFLRWLMLPATLLAFGAAVGLLWPKPKTPSQADLLIEVEARLRKAAKAPWRIERIEWADFVGRRVETNGRWIHAILGNPTERVPSVDGDQVPDVEELWFGRSETSLVQHAVGTPPSLRALHFLGVGRDMLVLRAEGPSGPAWPPLAERLAEAFELPVMDVESLWDDPMGGKAQFLRGERSLDVAVKEAHAEAFAFLQRGDAPMPDAGARRFGDCVYLWVEHREAAPGPDVQAQRQHLLEFVHRNQPDARTVVLCDVRAFGQGVQMGFWSNTPEPGGRWPAIPVHTLHPTEPPFPGSPAAD